MMKLGQLGLDFERYKLDFLSLQETPREADLRPTKMEQCGSTLHTLRGGMMFAALIGLLASNTWSEHQ